MIIELFFNLVTGVINLIPFELPNLPSQFNDTLDMLLDGIVSSLGLVNLFIDLKFWLACLSFMLLIYNIKKVWNSIIFCLNLIPGVNVTKWQ